MSSSTQLPSQATERKSQDGSHALSHAALPLAGISRFSTGRIDPFVPYPVELDARTLRLIDHCSCFLLMNN
jgi:hypothetical protein